MKNQIQNISRMACVAVLGGMMTACAGNDVRHTLGLERNQPDAFQVVKRPPLSVPPVYHLRPPSDEPVNTIPADARAQALVVRGEELPSSRAMSDDPAYMAETGVAPVNESSLGTTGESVFLSKAGAPQAQSNIRTVLNQETRAYTQTQNEQKDSLLEKINPFERKDGDPVVDAKAEAERIAKAKAGGEALNKGEVPEIDPKKEGAF